MREMPRKSIKRRLIRCVASPAVKDVRATLSVSNPNKRQLMGLERCIGKTKPEEFGPSWRGSNRCTLSF